MNYELIIMIISYPEADELNMNYSKQDKLMNYYQTGELHIITDQETKL